MQLSETCWLTQEVSQHCAVLRLRHPWGTSSPCGGVCTLRVIDLANGMQTFKKTRRTFRVGVEIMRNMTSLNIACYGGTVSGL